MNASQIAAVTAQIDERFTSGNDTPVDRAMISADEWAALRPAFQPFANLQAITAGVQTLQQARIIASHVENRDSDKLRAALSDLLARVIEYREYEHIGDPWAENARVMGEMEIDEQETLERYKKLASGGDEE